MPVCVLKGGLHTNTIGADTIGKTISFDINLPSNVVPSNIRAGVEVGQLTQDGVVLISSLFNFLGNRRYLTSIESAGIPLSTVEASCSDYATTISCTSPDCVPDTPPKPGKGQYAFGPLLVNHSKTYIPGSDGLYAPSTRDWCENVQDNYSIPVQKPLNANDMGWMSISCDIDEVRHRGRYTAQQQWEAADALNALLAYQICWTGIYPDGTPFLDFITRPDSISHSSWSSNLFDYFQSQTRNVHCEKVEKLCEGSEACTENGHPAGYGLNITSLLNKKIDLLP